jgi:putative phage-type endonuclease
MTLSTKRKGRVTGSQAGAILGLSPITTREKVMQEWLHNDTFKGNIATEHGKFYEPHAIADLELEIGIDVTPSNDRFFVSPEHDWIGATPDAFVGDDALAEIKCPYGKRKAESSDDFKLISEQMHYYAQVQIEMLCTGLSKCYFYQWTPTGVSKLEIVERDQAWLDENIPRLREFIDEYHRRKERMEKESDNIDYIGEQYLSAKIKFDDAKAELDAIRSLMIEHAQGNKARYGEVQCYPVSRKGSISYAKVIKDHLPELDLEPYRGNPTVAWTIK